MQNRPILLRSLLIIATPYRIAVFIRVHMDTHAVRVAPRYQKEGARVYLSSHDSLAFTNSRLHTFIRIHMVSLALTHSYVHSWSPSRSHIHTYTHGLGLFCRNSRSLLQKLSRSRIHTYTHGLPRVHTFIRIHMVHTQANAVSKRGRTCIFVNARHTRV